MQLTQAARLGVAALQSFSAASHSNDDAESDQLKQQGWQEALLGAQSGFFAFAIGTAAYKNLRPAPKTPGPTSPAPQIQIPATQIPATIDELIAKLDQSLPATDPMLRGAIPPSTTRVPTRYDPVGDYQQSLNSSSSSTNSWAPGSGGGGGQTAVAPVANQPMALNTLTPAAPLTIPPGANPALLATPILSQLADDRQRNRVFEERLKEFNATVEKQKQQLARWQEARRRALIATNGNPTAADIDKELRRLVFAESLGKPTDDPNAVFASQEASSTAPPAGERHDQGIYFEKEWIEFFWRDWFDYYDSFRKNPSQPLAFWIWHANGGRVAGALRAEKKADESDLAKRVLFDSKITEYVSWFRNLPDEFIQQLYSASKDSFGGDFFGRFPSVESFRIYMNPSTWVRPTNIGITDPYSSGNLLASAFAVYHPTSLLAVMTRRGYSGVHTPSTYHPNDFDAELVPQMLAAPSLEVTPGAPLIDRVHYLVPELREQHADTVIAGGELGVPLAQALSEALGTSTANHPPSPEVYYDKAAFYQALQDRGVPVAEFTRAYSLAEVRTFQGKLGVWPIVLKPTASAGTDDVIVCHNQAEVEAAFAKIYRQRNLMGRINEFVLAMEYVGGDELAVQHVSYEGVHRTSDILAYERPEVEGAGTVYANDILLPRHGSVQDEIVPLARRGLDAVGYRFGPSHLEIKWSYRRQEFVIIDGNFRLCGAGIPKYMTRATGRSQAEWTALAYMNAPAFIATADDYDILENFGMFFINSQGNGRFTRRHESDLKAIPGVTDYDFAYQEGDPLKRTTNGMTNVGWVVVYGATMDDVRASLAALRGMQDHGDFEIP